jgi:hypothetical protein
MSERFLDNTSEGQEIERQDFSRSALPLLYEPLILTLEEFAEKMKVGETTVWKWIRSGKLRPGRHFIQYDRVIRFHWCTALIDRLHEDCCSTVVLESDEQSVMAESSETVKKKHRYGNRINFDQ